MKIWNVLENEQEVRENIRSMDQFEDRGIISHPDTFQPHMMLVDKITSETFIVPLVLTMP